MRRRTERSEAIQLGVEKVERGPHHCLYTSKVKESS